MRTPRKKEILRFVNPKMAGTSLVSSIRKRKSGRPYDGNLVRLAGQLFMDVEFTGEALNEGFTDFGHLKRAGKSGNSWRREDGHGMPCPLH